MALKLHLNWTHKGVKLRNGHCYKFKYRNYQNDPFPHIFFMYAIRGVNPSTGHKWDLIQAVNLNYVPRARRRAFVKDWQDVLERSSNGSFHLKWPLIVAKWPFMRLAVRRYLLKPAGLIVGLEKIETKDMEQELIRSIKRDYSMIAARQRAVRVRRALNARRR